MGEERKIHNVLVGKPQGKRPPGRPRRRWENRIRIDLRENSWEMCIELDRLRIGTGGELL
jgi:hypothetical protein